LQLKDVAVFLALLTFSSHWQRPFSSTRRLPRENGFILPIGKIKHSLTAMVETLGTITTCQSSVAN